MSPFLTATTTIYRAPSSCGCHPGQILAPIPTYTGLVYEAKIAATRAAREAELTDLTYGMTVYPETP